MLLCSLLLSGCGVKGKLIPPEALVPAPVADLSALQRGSSVILSWSPVTRQESRLPLSEKVTYRIYRMETPVGQFACSRCDNTWRLIAPTAELPDPRSLYVDRDVQQRQTYRYRVIAVTRSSGESRSTTEPAITLQPTLLPPTLSALSVDNGIRLEIRAPQPLPATPGSGYLLFRTDDRQNETLLTPEPLPVTSFLDATALPGRSYRYSARAVTGNSGVPVESENSPGVETTFTLP